MKIMCKIKETNLGIDKLSFTEKKGKMAVYLTDGREVLIPVSRFKDIRYMPIKERNRWFILDDQYFTFENMSRVYSLRDVLSLNIQ